MHQGRTKTFGPDTFTAISGIPQKCDLVSRRLSAPAVTQQHMLTWLLVCTANQSKCIKALRVYLSVPFVKKWRKTVKNPKSQIEYSNSLLR